MSLYYRGIQTYLELDYSSFDRSIGNHPTIAMFDFLHALGFPVEWIDYFLKVMGSPVILKSGRQTWKRKFHHLIEPSGDFKTNFTDGIVNVIMLYDIYVNLRDSSLDIEDVPSYVTAQFGIKCSMAKVTVCPTEVTFLKGTFYKGTDRKYYWAPLVTQILNKAPTSRRSATWFAKQYAKAKGLDWRTVDGGAVMARTMSFYCGTNIPNIPIIKEYLSLLRTGACSLDTSLYIQLYEKAQNPYVERDNLHAFDYDAAFEQILARYSLRPDQLRLLVANISSLRRDQFLLTGVGAAMTLQDNID
jgi:hypothetical protein